MVRLENDALAFLEDSARWPYSPYCCLKRTNENEPLGFECGTLLDLGMLGPTVFLMDIYSLLEVPACDRAKLPHVTYHNMLEVLADGWEVD